MNRRNFLKTCAGGVAAAVVAPLAMLAGERPLTCWDVLHRQAEAGERWRGEGPGPDGFYFCDVRRVDEEMRRSAALTEEERRDVQFLMDWLGPRKSGPK